MSDQVGNQNVGFLMTRLIFVIEFVYIGVAMCDLMHNAEAAFEPQHEKTNVLVSDLVRHKPGCTATEIG